MLMKLWPKIGPMNTLLTKPIHKPAPRKAHCGGSFRPRCKTSGLFICKLFSGKTSLAVSKTRFVKQSEKILQNSWGNIWWVLCGTLIFGYQ